MTANCIALLFFVFGGVLAALPEGWSACKQSSPDYKDCLKKQITNAIAYVKDGSKKLGVFPLDPLRFESMLIDQGSGPVSIKLLLKDVDFIGMSKAKIIAVENDWKRMVIEYHLDRFDLDGKYPIKGQVLVLPISGEGKCSQVWEDLTIRLKMDLEEVEKDGGSYFQVTKMPVDIDTKKVTFNFDNLFNGNKAMSDNMNKFLNENWEPVINELKPAISRALEIGYMQYINRILARILASDINLK